jgi:hypothetical protein
MLNNIKSILIESNKYIKSSFSQCGEDLIIHFILDTLGIENPSWLDIGANHPYKYNNTALFYKNGHRGINIEADPEMFKQLIKHRSKDVNINIGISNVNSQLDFYIMSANTLNTFSSIEANKYVEMGYKIIKIIPIKTITINELILLYCNNKFPEILSLNKV